MAGKQASFLRSIFFSLMLIICLSGGSFANQSDQFTAGINKFGIELFEKLLDSEECGDNVFISTLSIYYALGMTLNGAEGETLEEMLKTLHLYDMTLENINSEFRNSILNLPTEDAPTRFQIANSIWYDDAFNLRPEAIDAGRDNFMASIRSIDLQSAEAVDQINGWVNDNTRGLIKDIIDAPMDPELVMILINAIYFKGYWETEFDPVLTREDDFFVTHYIAAPCQMMHIKSEFGYQENDLFQAINLPYSGGKYSATIILPRRDKFVSDALDYIKNQDFITKSPQMYDREVSLYLPKFKLEYKTDLNEPLRAMGMKIPFTQKADFSGFTPGGGIWIDRVKHKTFVQLDEAGTEAAAVTAVTMRKCAIPEPPPEMRVDHPFLFSIIDNDSGRIIFLGEIDNPEWPE